MQRPIVSVIIPTYNRPEMLVRAIESVLNQTFDELEVVVIDDASTVDVKGVVEGIDDDRIQYIRHHRNMGVAAAMNTGIQMATGQYVAFLGDDDIYAKEKIERQLEVFEECPSTVGLVYSGLLYFGEVGQFLGRKDPGNQGWDALEHIDRIGGTPLVRRICFEDVGLFDEGFKCLEDWDMWLRISDRYDFRFCPEPLYKAHSHSSSSLSGNLALIIKFLDRLYEKHAHRLKYLPKRTKKRMYSKYHRTRAVSFYDSGMIREGKEEAIKSVFLNPLSVELWKLVIVGFFGARIYDPLKALNRNLQHKLPSP